MWPTMNKPKLFGHLLHFPVGNSDMPIVNGASAEAAILKLMEARGGTADLSAAKHRITLKSCRNTNLTSLFYIIHLGSKKSMLGIIAQMPLPKMIELLG
jgi:hypothetical protein